MPCDEFGGTIRLHGPGADFFDKSALTQVGQSIIIGGWPKRRQQEPLETEAGGRHAGDWD